MKTTLHPNQAGVASALGINVAAQSSAIDAIAAIESALGQKAIEQRALWFVVSVLRHLRKAKWTQLDDSGLDEARRISLAQQCIAVQGFTTSLKTLTKDSRSKFRILGFARSKNMERGVLAAGTKAYSIAKQVLVEAGLVESARAAAAPAKPKPESTKATKEVKAEPKAIEKTVVGRRAQRRGYSSDEVSRVADSARALSEKNQLASMSEEEFANLEAALSDSDAEIVQSSWADQHSEDRWSRTLGVIAGIGFFVFVALLFL